MRGQSKSLKCHIGVDLLGSDTPPSELLEAILLFSQEKLDPSVHLTLLGTPSVFADIPSRPGVLFHTVENAITMEDPPLSAIRSKRNSSLCTGIALLKNGHLDAFITAGNTGALIACAKIELPELPNVERPALLTLLPTKKNEIAVLDVGANTTYKASHLVQFAAMGIAYQKSRGVKTPKVGLLNIGSEAKKGTPELQEAYDQLFRLSQGEDSPFIFAGNIEGRDVFQGEIDVLVTDGFTGNVFLKTAEGLAAVVIEELSNHAMVAEMRKRLDYAEYPGAVLCGIDGIVMKCHGTANPKSLIQSIIVASRLTQHHFLAEVKKELLYFGGKRS
jgi:glycerol-3-phosphate acyltransferase PlsX